MRVCASHVPEEQIAIAITFEQKRYVRREGTFGAPGHHDGKAVGCDKLCNDPAINNSKSVRNIHDGSPPCAPNSNATAQPSGFRGASESAPLAARGCASKLRLMGQPLTIPPGFEKLPVRQQIEYVQALWKRIGEGQADIPGPDWHAEVVEKRLAEYRADPASAIAWEDLRGELLARFGRRR